MQLVAGKKNYFLWSEVENGREPESMNEEGDHEWGGDDGPSHPATIQLTRTHIKVFLDFFQIWPISRNTNWKAWKSRPIYSRLLLPQVCGAVNTTPYLEGMLYMGIWYEAVSQPASLSADKAGCPLSHDERQVKLIRLSQWASRFEVIKGNDCKLSWQDWSNENLLGSCYQVAFKDD